MADHRKTGMTPAEIRNALGRHVRSVHRIQEVQAAVVFALWEAVQQRLDQDDG